MTILSRFPVFLFICAHPATEQSSEDEQGNADSPSSRENASTWARLIKKVYGVDPLVCPKCGKEMKIIAIIPEPEETTKIYSPAAWVVQLLLNNLLQSEWYLLIYQSGVLISKSGI